MSWVTILWSMAASACLTLGVIYALAWSRHRTAWAHLWFSLTALSAAGFIFCELWMMRADTPAELLRALRWTHVALFGWLVSIVWFVWTYLQAGRVWLAWAICGLRALVLLLAWTLEPSVNYLAIPTLDQIRFLGESVTVHTGVPNPWALIGLVASVLRILFVADASLTAWRRGDRRKALLIGGSVEVLLLFVLSQTVLVFWLGVRMPIVYGVLFLGLLAVMGYELSRDVFRASQLVTDLQVSEAGLRENHSLLQASHTQVSELLGRLIAAQETERTRIARDLHDDVSQRIAGLSLRISRVKRTLVGHPEQQDVLTELDAMQGDARALAEGIRHVAHDLHPALLQHVGLVGALQAFCTEFGRLQAVAVTFEASHDTGPIEAAMATCLYRVAQEALHNIAKHAEARQINVLLARSAAGVQLSISDDGKGFDLTGPRGKGSGLGLVSIEERVRLLRGTVRIQTRHGGGTSVHVQIPAR